MSFRQPINTLKSQQPWKLARIRPTEPDLNKYCIALLKHSGIIRLSSVSFHAQHSAEEIAVNLGLPSVASRMSRLPLGVNFSWN